MSALDAFLFDGAQVRVVTFAGEPWFVLADLCAVLGVANARNVAARLDDDMKGVHPVDTPGGAQNVTVVSEAGMYEVVIRSDKPEAARFRRWITSDVLPQIRRTGSYVAQETPEQLMARALVTAQGVIERKDEQIAVLAPRAEAWDELASAEGDYSVADAAKVLSRAGVKTGPQRLFEQLAGIKWIYRAHDRRWRVYAGTVDAGYLTEKLSPPRRDRITDELVAVPPQVRVTARGLERLRVRLGSIT